MARQHDGSSLGRPAGPVFSAELSALAGVLLVLGGAALAAWLWLGFSPVEAVLAGLGATVLHWTADLLHQLGHAIAARRTGYPMAGLHFWFLFTRSVYPADEPALSGRVHVQRALGGPIASGLLAIVASGLALAARPWSGIGDWLLVFFALENWVLGPGALLPLGFTDGSTLRRWWGL